MWAQAPTLLPSRRSRGRRRRGRALCGAETPLERERLRARAGWCWGHALPSPGPVKPPAENRPEKPKWVRSPRRRGWAGRAPARERPGRSSLLSGRRDSTPGVTLGEDVGTGTRMASLQHPLPFRGQTRVLLPAKTVPDAPRGPRRCAPPAPLPRPLSPGCFSSFPPRTIAPGHRLLYSPATSTPG